jgi:hypothetical protein
VFDFLYDIHKGETCFVIGNGPSLKDVPNEFLNRHPSFGSNRIYLKYLPTYYVVINELLIKQYKEEIDALETTKFAREDTNVRNAFPLHLVEAPMFSFAPTEWVFDGHNTTFVLLQLAFWMGFTTVKLVGVDHRYEFEGLPNQTLRMEGDDPNHFDPEYFKGAQWQAPDLEVSELAYVMAKEAYEANGRQIVNITRGSALTVFPIEGEP